MEESYIKLFRRLLRWRWFRDPSVAHLFVYLLLRAKFVDTGWRDITIKRGQLVTSRFTMAEETGLTDRVVRRCLMALQRTGEITVEANKKYSLITINKYSDYQGVTKNMAQVMSKQRPSKGQDATINKERKNGIKQQPDSPKPPVGDGVVGGNDATIGVEATPLVVDVSVVKDTLVGYEAFDLNFVNPVYKNAFFKWLNYKREQYKFLYRSQDTLNTCYTSLVRLSGSDPLKAMAIVEQSIANSWKGLFDLNSMRYGNSKEQSIGTRIQRDALAAAEFSHRLDQERRANLCSGDQAEVWEP